MSFASEEEITARVKSVKVGGSSFDVHEGIIDDDYLISILPTSHSFKPVIVMTYGGGTETARRYQHLCGAAMDSEQKIFTVTVIGTEDKSTRRVIDQVKKSLKGYEPTNCGEIRPALYASTTGRSTLGSPTRYTAVQSFTYMSNADPS